MPHIIHKFYSIFGYKIEIRVESPEFQATMNHLSNLVDDGKVELFKTAYEAACKKYNRNDPEMIRISWIAEELV